MIWSKSFIQERERFDGADVMHLIRGRADRLNWRRLIDRFGPHWRVLLAHVVMFGYVYPGEKSRLPEWVLKELTRRLAGNENDPPEGTSVTRGTLLSRQQYLVDVQQWGYQDARNLPDNAMTEADIAFWTKCIEVDG